MKKIVRAVMVAVVLAYASTASAQFSFDLKAAYALPLGNVWGTSPWNPSLAMTSAWSGAIPFEVGARYHVTPNTSLGLYFQWGPAFTTASAFDNIAGTSGSDMRVGLELMYEFSPQEALNPWFLIGTGWEWTTYSGKSSSITVNGWEYLNVQAGLDFKLANAFGIGPYVGFLAGTYSNISATGTSLGWGGSIPSDGRSFHGWLQFGVKATMNL